jgi:hypothetical protein
MGIRFDFIELAAGEWSFYPNTSAQLSTSSQPIAQLIQLLQRSDFVESIERVVVRLAKAPPAQAKQQDSFLLNKSSGFAFFFALL